MFYKFFSQRQRGEEANDVWQYDEFPVEFKNQLMYILSDVCKCENMEMGLLLAQQFCREKGIKELGGYVIRDVANVKRAFENYITESSDEELLDLIDFICHMLNWCITAPNNAQYVSCETQNAIRCAFVELNDRFKQHNLGYEATKGQLIRMDNQFVHAQYVKPALQLLCDKEFAGAEDEYRNALEARRAGNNKEAILNAGKCFESVMKTICEKKKYDDDNVENYAAKDLLETLKKNNFFPAYMNDHLTNVIGTLKRGAPVVRNKVAGHGQGSEIIEVPDCLVDYMLGLVAVNTVLLVKLYKASK